MVTKCIRGHFQPLLLFYANPDGSAIAADDASSQNSGQPHYKASVNGEMQGMTCLHPLIERQWFAVTIMTTGIRALINKSVSVDNI